MKFWLCWNEWWISCGLHSGQNIIEIICIKTLLSPPVAQVKLKDALSYCWPDTTWSFKVPEVSLIATTVRRAKQQSSRAGMALCKENVSLKLWVGGILFFFGGGGSRGGWRRLVVCFALFCVVFFCLFVCSRFSRYCLIFLNVSFVVLGFTESLGDCSKVRFVR